MGFYLQLRRLLPADEAQRSVDEPLPRCRQTIGFHSGPTFSCGHPTFPRAHPTFLRAPVTYLRRRRTWTRGLSRNRSSHPTWPRSQLTSAWCPLASRVSQAAARDAGLAGRTVRHRARDCQRRLLMYRRRGAARRAARHPPQRRAHVDSPARARHDEASPPRCSSALPELPPEPLHAQSSRSVCHARRFRFPRNRRHVLVVLLA